MNLISEMSKREGSDSEEEILVFAEFEDNVNINKYRSVHILGVNDKNPIIQMDDTFFIGKHESSLGTYMFFEEDPSPKCEDPLFDKLPDKNLKFVCKTRKHISMEHAYVTPKEGKDTTCDGAKAAEDEVKPVTFNSIQQAIDSFDVYFNKESKTKQDLKVCDDDSNDLASRPYFPALVKYMGSGPVIPMVWEGINAVKSGRAMLIDVNTPGSIRGDYCTISKHGVIIHGADSVEAANREINLWFDKNEIISSALTSDSQ